MVRTYGSAGTMAIIPDQVARLLGRHSCVLENVGATLQKKFNQVN
jgi:hypothetical protein